ncbi:hypothetical protein JOB18_024617 [Solea senegalensis]|uniref:Uncharacterized protein n=1 Tax=Solea senegalensis TaxID=28829 RepID=A0AAV6T7D1_SOLSE|nr:hypothetical protein JOB18_024617 [Solea senegalensis]
MKSQDCRIITGLNHGVKAYSKLTVGFPLLNCQFNADKTILCISSLSPDTVELITEFAYVVFDPVTEDNIKELTLVATTLKFQMALTSVPYDIHVKTNELVEINAECRPMISDATQIICICGG